jgi:hypothetical protein
LGSCGYAFAKLTEKEELKASLGVPQIFLSNLGRLNEDRLRNITTINALKNILVLRQLPMKIPMKK